MRRGTILTVSAASSLTNAFQALAKHFQDCNPRVRVRFNFGGSNLLARQIEAGGRGVDVFAAAGEMPMETLVAKGLVQRSGVRMFASNRIVLIVPRGNPAGVSSFGDLADERVTHIAMGAAKVPVGRYAEQVLRHLRLFEGAKHKIVYAIHARQVLDYVARGEVEAGLVYATDAAMMANDVDIVARADESWHDPIRYPIALLGRTNPRDSDDRASAFVGFVLSDTGADILASFGFGHLGGKETHSPGTQDSMQPSGARASNASSSGAWTAMKLSLMAAMGAMLVVFPLGTLLGAVLARCRFPGRELLDSLVTLPMILPPTVTGYYLIIALGARSPVGEALESWFGVRVVLTLLGATVASAVIAMPLMVKSARAAFESVDREYELASYTLGKSRAETWFRITLPLAKNGLVAGAILSFARAIGEFGATFMLAGIIPGQTMTMPSAIFHAFTNHEDRTAQTLVLLLTGFSVMVIYVTNRVNARQADRRRR